MTTRHEVFDSAYLPPELAENDQLPSRASLEPVQWYKVKRYLKLFLQDWRRLGKCRVNRL